MKTLKFTSFVILLCLTLQSCVQKTSSNKRANSSSNSLNNNNNNNDVGYIDDTNVSNGTVTGCSDGVSRSGATRCYFKLPTLTFSGNGRSTSGHYWSSAYNLPSGFSSDNLRTDMTFSVRIKPVYADASLSQQGRKCSQWTKVNWNRLRVQLMLSKASDNGLSTNIETFTAKVNEYSNTVRFNVPNNANGPLVLSVHSFMSDHRCFHNGSKYVYGNLDAQTLNACKNGLSFYDIPLNTSASAETECIAFNVEFATDYTYDLP